MTLTRSTAAATAPLSVISPVTSSAPWSVKGFAFIGDRASTRTRSPPDRRRRTKLVPKNPVAPVTSTFIPKRPPARGLRPESSSRALLARSPRRAHARARHTRCHLRNRRPVGKHVRIGGVGQRAVALTSLDAASELVRLTRSPDRAEVVVVLA